MSAPQARTLQRAFSSCENGQPCVQCSDTRACQRAEFAVHGPESSPHTPSADSPMEQRAAKTHLSAHVRTRSVRTTLAADYFGNGLSSDAMLSLLFFLPSPAGRHFLRFVSDSVRVRKKRKWLLLVKKVGRHLTATVDRSSGVYRFGASPLFHSVIRDDAAWGVEIRSRLTQVWPVLGSRRIRVPMCGWQTAQDQNGPGIKGRSSRAEEPG